MCDVSWVSHKKAEKRGGTWALIPRSFQQSFSAGPSGGVPCDLSHNAPDVTCLLSRHQLMGLAWCSCLYTAAPVHHGKGHMGPPLGIKLDWQTDWQTNTTENITFPQTTYAGGNNPSIFASCTIFLIQATSAQLCKGILKLHLPKLTYEVYWA